MGINKLVFGVLALGCLAAAAGGGFLAARQTSQAGAELAGSPPASTPDDGSAAPIAAPGKVVTESEGLIAPESSAPARPVPDDAPTAVAPRKASPPPARVAPRSQPRVQPAAPSSRPSRAANRPVPVENTAPARSTGNNGTMWETRPIIEPDRVPVDAEPDPPPPPPAPEIVELVIPADAVLGLQIERTVSSETARVEDRVDARVTRDVRVGGRVAIPAGSIVQGSVMEVERGGKVRERARLGIRFHTVVLADGSRLNIRTDSVMREGTSPAGESAAKIGGAAVGGAILGAILGGGKGAVLGGAAGAAGGTAATMSGGRNPAVLPAGTTVSVRVQQPVTVTVSPE